MVFFSLRVSRACADGATRQVARRLRIAGLPAALLLGATFPGAQAAPPADWAEGRILIETRAGLSQAALADVIRPHGGTSRRLGASNLHVVGLPAGVSELAVLERLKQHPQLKFAELDRRVAHALVSNDPYLGSEWHVPRIRADLAWDAAAGAGVTVAICDSGVLPTHPDLVQVPGWNFVTNTANTADVAGHGTAVAGAAAAVTNNGAGVAGVAGAARVMPGVVSDATNYAYYSTIANCVTYAADHGARVANASFAGVYASSAIQSAGNYLKGKGGLLVVAAGNSGANDGSPAITSMIPVSATDANDQRASWSSFGNYVAVAAPGVGIWTTSADGTYRSASGTSFASPITAGVVALMMSANPALSAGTIESLLYASAADLGAAGKDIYFGWGRVDAYAAVQAARSTAGADTQAPAVAIAAPVGGSSVSGLVAVDVAASDNVGVTRVDLRVNGSTVASDSTAPYQFSWDSGQWPNGAASLSAVAYDAAGNSKASTAVSVTVANAVVADSTPPQVAISNPSNGSKVSGNLTVSVSASDNAGAAGIRQSLHIDGVLVASASGSKLSYKWNTTKLATGAHSLKAVATDAAGNAATMSISVSK
jgi:thermitase